MDSNYLSSQVSTIIGQLHSLFDEIGVPSHDRDSRESEVRYTRTARSYHRLTFM
jgi:protein regulator of cytokinesis 1